MHIWTFTIVETYNTFHNRSAFTLRFDFHLYGHFIFDVLLARFATILSKGAPLCVMFMLMSHFFNSLTYAMLAVLETVFCLFAWSVHNAIYKEQTAHPIILCEYAQVIRKER